MKKLLLILPVFCLCFIGCGPDLIIEDEYTLNWSDTLGGTKTLEVTVTNIGNEDSGEYMVYIDLDEDPVSQNHRPQVRKQYENLEPGESEIISEDFTPLEHLDNLYLINVFQITVIADPKSMVDELNETNNEKVIPVPH